MEPLRRQRSEPDGRRSGNRSHICQAADRRRRRSDRRYRDGGRLELPRDDGTRAVVPRQDCCERSDARFRNLLLNGVSFCSLPGARAGFGGLGAGSAAGTGGDGLGSGASARWWIWSCRCRSWGVSTCSGSLTALPDFWTFRLVRAIFSGFERESSCGCREVSLEGPSPTGRRRSGALDGPLRRAGRRRDQGDWRAGRVGRLTPPAGFCLRCLGKWGFGPGFRPALFDNRVSEEICGRFRSFDRRTDAYRLIRLRPMI